MNGVDLSWRGLLNGVDRRTEAGERSRELLGRGRRPRLVVAVSHSLEVRETTVGDLPKQLHPLHVAERQSHLNVLERLLQREREVTGDAPRRGPSACDEEEPGEPDAERRAEESGPRGPARTRRERGHSLLHEARAQLPAELVAELRLGHARHHLERLPGRNELAKRTDRAELDPAHRALALADERETRACCSPTTAAHALLLRAA